MHVRKNMNLFSSQVTKRHVRLEVGVRQWVCIFGDFPSGDTWELYRVAIRSKERTHFQDSEIINIP